MICNKVPCSYVSRREVTLSLDVLQEPHHVSVFCPLNPTHISALARRTLAPVSAALRKNVPDGTCTLKVMQLPLELEKGLSLIRRTDISMEISDHCLLLCTLLP